MNDVKECFLIPIEKSHEPIVLSHGEEITLGRGAQTKITDTRCSRKQVSIVADTASDVVRVKQIGGNSSAVNGLALNKNEIYNLKHGDQLEMLLGQHAYIIEFRLKNLNAASSQKAVKREAEQACQPSKRLCPSPEEDDLRPSSEEKWEFIDNNSLIIFTAKGVKSSQKIAAYDIDGTIILTKSGRVFPKDTEDWKISFTEVPGKLKLLWKSGFKIVFLTNQAGISKGNVKIEDFRSKIHKIIAKLGVPVQVFISTGKGIYRKPVPGMWNVLLQKKNDGLIVDMKESFYCGDAAGREANWAPKKKKDFSCSDRLFALNVGLKFYTPEEHFLGNKAVPFKLPDFNPSALKRNRPLCEPQDAKLRLGEQEVIVLVGGPGSGKSFFARTHLVPKGFVHVNRDTLGSWQRCVSSMEDALKKGKSVVVDNTNPDKESRRRYSEIAKKYNTICRCFVLATSPENAKHNNKFRELTDDSHVPISEAIINVFRTKYEEPTMDEGFSAIVKVNFVPVFTNPEHEKLYTMYLL